jgi:HEAT repeat protein/DNA-binding MarR family transcriptional regulator
MTVILHHYRPHLDKAEDLEAISVAREPLLDEMLSRLQRWEPGASRQHYLLIGPRGIGKTHLLRLLQHRLPSVPPSERKWFCLSFPEEQYAVTSVPDLLIETLHALAEASGDRTLAERYQRVRRESDDQAVVDLTLDALRNFCKARACGVLLMLENLDRLLQDQIKKDSQIGLLRKILIEEDWPVLIATSPTYLSDVTDPQKPFFEFFQVVTLDELSPEDVETLLHKRAELDSDNDFLAYLKRYRSRLRALYHFSGGNPRLTLMLYDLLSRRALTDVKIELDGLLNQLTPFYQDRMKEVGPQEAKVLTTIALLAEGVTPTELADECRMDRALVSALLSRLEKAGYVRREPRERKQTVYAIPERFFRIWHQMSASRLARGRIQYLLDFFSTWYATPEERDEVWDRLLTQFQEGAEYGEDARIEDVSAYMDYIAAVSEGTERFERHFDRLRQHAQTGDMDYVLRELQALDSEFDGDAEYFAYKGEFLAHELQSDQMAFEAFREAAELNQDQLESRFNEAVALDKLGRREEALDAYEHLVEHLSAQRDRKTSEDTTQLLLHLLAEALDDRLFRIAAHLLGRIGDPTAGPQLVHVLRSASTPWRRAHCATALGLLGAADTSPILIECLRDEDDYVRGCAATALGRIGSSEAMPALITCLSDKAQDVRSNAAAALGRIGSSEAVPALIPCLRDEAQNVRGNVAAALGRIGSPEAVPALIACLRDEAHNVRSNAAAALGRIGSSDAVPALIACLRDEAHNVRCDAAAALDRIGSSAAVSPLIACLHDKVQSFRCNAAAALGKIGSSEAVSPLIACLGDEAHSVRTSVAAALGRIGSSETVPALVGCLSDEAHNVRGSAAAVLGRIGASEAVPALIRCLCDQAHSVRGSAATALGNIGASAAVPPLIACLSDQADNVRGSAATALGSIGASEAVPSLIVSLGDKAHNVRGSAATALGRIGASVAVPALITSLSDKASDVRGSAAVALGYLITRRTIATVIDAVSALARALNLRKEEARVAGTESFLRAAFSSGNLGVAEAFVEGFVSEIDNGAEVLLPHRIALDLLRSNKDPMILLRQPPEMREAVELLVSIFDQNGKGD